MKKPPPTTPAIDEILAEQLHIWYLEATEELSPDDFNFDAQKGYEDLTQGQKFIDRYIANKVNQFYAEEMLKSLPKKRVPQGKVDTSGMGQLVIGAIKSEGYNQAIAELRTAITKRFLYEDN